MSNLSQNSAEISNCGMYRYALRRIWDNSKPYVLFIGLNPSTADAIEEDNTSRVCINYAKSWGYGGLLIGNLFAYRSADSSVLWTIKDPIGPQNDQWLNILQAEAAMVVCAWTDDGGFKYRDRDVFATIKNPHCLQKLKSGRPGHPLYKRADLKPVLLTDYIGTA